MSSFLEKEEKFSVWFWRRCIVIQVKCWRSWRRKVNEAKKCRLQLWNFLPEWLVFYTPFPQPSGYFVSWEFLPLPVFASVTKFINKFWLARPYDLQDKLSQSIPSVPKFNICCKFYSHFHWLWLVLQSSRLLSAAQLIFTHLFFFLKHQTKEP